VPGLAVAVGGILLAFTGCGGDEQAGGDPDRPRPTASTSTVPAVGTGVVVVGPDRLDFEVRACTDEPAADDRPQAHRVFLMDGDGTIDGQPFAVETTRYESTGPGSEALTITETIRITTGTGEAIEGVEAERSGIGGDWLDLRDPEADGALVVQEGDVVRAVGTFGPDGSTEGEPNVVAGRMVARCPA
jgi:hypothetical protein